MSCQAFFGFRRHCQRHSVVCTPTGELANLTPVRVKVTEPVVPPVNDTLRIATSPSTLPKSARKIAWRRAKSQPRHPLGGGGYTTLSSARMYAWVTPGSVQLRKALI